MLATVALPALVAQAAERTIRGRIVDEAGKPVPGAEIAEAWTIDAAGIRPLEGTRTDADGRFSLGCAYLGDAVTLLAYDFGRTRGAFLRVEPAAIAEVQTAVLGPLARVRGALWVDDRKFYPAGGLCWLVPQAPLSGPIRIEPEKGKISALVPVGRYVLTAQSPKRTPQTKPVTLEAGKGDVDVGPIDLAEREGRIDTGNLAPPFVYKEAAPEFASLLRERHFPRRWTLCFFWEDT